MLMPGESRASVEFIHDFRGNNSHHPGDERVSLVSEWELTPNRYVDPLNSHAEWKDAKAVRLPGGWRGIFPDAKIVSLKTTIITDPIDGLALYVLDITSAASIYVNGELMGSIGVPGLDAKTTQPSRDTLLIDLPRAERYEILIHIARFYNSHGGVWAPIEFGQRSVIARKILFEQIIEGCFFGGTLAIALYHLFLFFIRREPISAAFALCCIAVSLRIISSNSRLLTLWCDLGWNASYTVEYASLYLIAPAIELFFATIFRDEYPRKLWLLRVVPYTLILSTAFFDVEIMNHFLWYGHLHHLIAMAIIVYTLIKAYAHKQVGSSWILIGSMFMIVFSLIDMGKAYFGRSGTFVIHIGFSVFILSQAAAIAQVYTRIYRRLLDEELKRKHSFQQLGKVFYPHQLKMMSEGIQLEHTMPTGSAQACAISFDIIASTKIKHIDKMRIIKDFFSKCYEIMMEGYDPNKLTANAYRVKELGDGFLCTIGYPFKIPDEQQNIAAFSVSLAHRFAVLFEEHRSRLDYDRPIHFGLGIALGELYAFYPDTGTKEYDVHGKAVILATRYEQMRKYLAESRPKTSFVILQEDVYLSLPANMRSLFECIDLAEHMIAVRDDPDADKIYIQAIGGKSSLHDTDAA